MCMFDCIYDPSRLSSTYFHYLTPRSSNVLNIICHHRSESFERDRSQQASTSSRSKPQERPTVTEADLEGKSPEEQEMMKTMGFCGFDTTKNKKVEGNNAGEVHVILKRKYRQYMNRKGGFNRPLDFVA